MELYYLFKQLEDHKEEVKKAKARKASKDWRRDNPEKSRISCAKWYSKHGLEYHRNYKRKIL